VIRFPFATYRICSCAHHVRGAYEAARFVLALGFTEIRTRVRVYGEAPHQMTLDEEGD
jgi:hypothetical protein